MQRRWPRNCLALASMRDGTSSFERPWPSRMAGSLTRQAAAGRRRAGNCRRRGARTRPCPQSPRRSGRRSTCRARRPRRRRPGKRCARRRRWRPERRRRRRRRRQSAARAASGPDRRSEKDGHRRLQHDQPAPGKLQEAQLGQQIPQRQRNGKLEKQNRGRDEGKGNTTGVWPQARRLAPPTRPSAPSSATAIMMTARMETCEQHLVVGSQRGVGVAGKEPTVLDLLAGVVGGLANVDPALLPGGGDQVEGGQADAQRARQSQRAAPEPRSGAAARRPARRRPEGSRPSRRAGAFESQAPATTSASGAAEPSSARLPGRSAAIARRASAKSSSSGIQKPPASSPKAVRS